MRMRMILVGAFLVAIALGLFWRFGPHNSPASSHVIPSGNSAQATSPGANPRVPAAVSATKIYAHNLLLRKGPRFRVYIPWLRGEIGRAQAGTNPSFDDPQSFFLDIHTGVLHANIGDISNFLNSTELPKPPLTNIKLSGDGDQVKLSGTLHKIIPLPVELTGTLSVMAGNRIQVRVTKLNVLKIPFKALLGGLHIKVSDLFHPSGMQGIEVNGNDIVFDPQKILPPPHIRGRLSKVRIVNPDLEEVYGAAEHEEAKVEQWRNFLRLRDGTLDFGKLTMHHVDLMMIDISNDAWFDLDLANYQEQLVNGYTRMTPQAGLQIFMPDVDDIPRKGKQNTSIEWLKNRNIAPPSDVMSRH